MCRSFGLEETCAHCRQHTSRPPAFSSIQVTQEVSHPVTTPKKASKVASGGTTAEPKSPAAAASGDTPASALAVERPVGLRRSISQPIERGKGRAAATRKVTLFERCTTTTLESSSSSLSAEDCNGNGKKVPRRNKPQSLELCSRSPVTFAERQKKNKTGRNNIMRAETSGPCDMHHGLSIRCRGGSGWGTRIVSRQSKNSVA